MMSDMSSAVNLFICKPGADPGFVVWERGLRSLGSADVPLVSYREEPW